MAHVFVIDDDDQLLRMVGLMLERGGHSATLMSNPLEALDLLQEEVPDLAILDVMMPGMDGFELCREIRRGELTKDLPVIMLTARGPLSTGNEALEAGADQYLTKPVTSQELLGTVDRLLLEKENRPPAEAVEAPLVEENDAPPVSDDQPTAGMLIPFFSLSGGVGKTTCAVNLANALAQKELNKVCLVDLTTSGGHAAMHLRLQPNLQLGPFFGDGQSRLGACQKRDTDARERALIFAGASDADFSGSYGDLPLSTAAFHLERAVYTYCD